MLNETQLVIAVAGVCVLALVLIVLGRRRRNSESRAEHRAETRTDDHAVEAVVVDEPGRMVLARTHDGTQYQGTLAEPDETSANGAFLTLTGPIVFRRSGGEPETMPSEWDRLALPRADVAEVWTRSAAVTTVTAPTTEPTLAPEPLEPETSTEDAIARLREGVEGTDGDPGEDAATSRRHTRRERRSPVTTP